LYVHVQHNTLIDMYNLPPLPTSPRTLKPGVVAYVKERLIHPYL